MAAVLNFERNVAIALEYRQSAKKRTGETWVVVMVVQGNGENNVAAVCRCAATPRNVSATARVRAACPIIYRQNTLKMPQASRAVIIEETRARIRERKRERNEAKLRRGKLRAVFGLREEDEDACCHMRPRQYSYALSKLLRTDTCNIAALHRIVWLAIL